MQSDRDGGDAEEVEVVEEVVVVVTWL